MNKTIYLNFSKGFYYYITRQSGKSVVEIQRLRYVFSIKKYYCYEKQQSNTFYSNFAYFFRYFLLQLKATKHEMNKSDCFLYSREHVPTTYNCFEATQKVYKLAELLII